MAKEWTSNPGSNGDICTEEFGAAGNRTKLKVRLDYE
jgi:hypothetical protein